MATGDSLIRFRCVCKSWCVLIENPNFISKHANNNRCSIDHRRILVSRRENHKSDYFMSLSYETLDVKNEAFGFQYPYTTRFTFHEMLGSFNGVVCFFQSERWDFVFWNPAIRQMKISSKCPFLSHPNFLERLPECGFRYDFKTNDFKAFSVISMSFPAGQEEDLMTTHIAVYSLGTDSWKLIDAPFPRDYNRNLFMLPGTCIKGFCSRLMVRTLHPETYLVTFLLFTFDMSDERFILTPMHESELIDLQEHNRRYNALTSLDDSVAYITFNADPYISELSFQVSVLDKYGPDGKWTKLYTIGPFSGILVPMVFWKNHELFLKSEHETLFLCDPATNELKSLNLVVDMFELSEYTESLVSFN